MKIYVIGGTKNEFQPIDRIRKKFYIDKKHSGDNIDNLNPWYCELTGLYYMWKHESDSVVGLEHYRRNFVTDNGALLGKGDIESILKKNDIIVHESTSNKTDVWYVTRNQKMPMFERYLMVVRGMRPDFYDTYRKYLSNPTFIQNNMFIGKKELVDSYCSFLFESLGMFHKAEKHFNLLEPREIGYISEYFFGAYLKAVGARICKCKQNFAGTIR